MNESLKAIIKQTDMLLWNSYHASLDSQYDALNTRLIFPKSASKSIRVSEQEARFIFSNQLNNSTFLFSVETPTQQGYQQKGTKKAQSEERKGFVAGETGGKFAEKET